MQNVYFVLMDPHIFQGICAKTHGPLAGWDVCYLSSASTLAADMRPCTHSCA